VTAPRIITPASRRKREESASADGARLETALTNLRAWAEGRRRGISTADVRRVLAALFRINRGAAVHMAEVAAWRRLEDGKSTLVAADGSRLDGGDSKKDLAAVLWCRRQTDLWAGAVATDVPEEDGAEAPREGERA